MHLLIDISSGIRAPNSGAMVFFLTQVLGIVVEDLVKRTYSSIMRTSNRPAMLIERIVGFTWVTLFLSWSIPVYLYPMLYRTSAGLEDSTIPFSIVRMLV